MKLIISIFLCLAFVGCGTISASPNDAQPLNITTSQGEHVTLTLSKVAQSMKGSNYTVLAHPAYNKESRQYEGFDLLQFLKMVDPQLDVTGPFWLEVTTLDGWKGPLYDANTLRSGKAFLAVKELRETLRDPVSEDGLWSLIVTPKKTVSPGPFYIVWNDPGKNPDIFPAQVSGIKILKKKPK